MEKPSERAVALLQTLIAFYGPPQKWRLAHPLDRSVWLSTEPAGIEWRPCPPMEYSWSYCGEEMGKWYGAWREVGMGKGTAAQLECIKGGTYEAEA